MSTMTPTDTTKSPALAAKSIIEDAGFATKPGSFEHAADELSKIEPEQHPDDAAVDAFATAMKSKLADARAKGRAGWNNDEPGMQQRLSNLLRTHVEKGDPRDVANFAMFLHQRGESILPKPEQSNYPEIPDSSNPEQAVGDAVGDAQFVAEAKSSPEHQTDMLLCRAVLNHAVIDTPRPAVATPAEVTASNPVMPYSGTEASAMMFAVIEDIMSQARGTNESAHDFVSWHLPRIRSLLQWIDAALATQPSTVGVLEMATIDDARKRGYQDNARGWVAGWNDCRFAMLAATEVSRA